MIGTVIAIGVGIVVVAFAGWSLYSDLSRASYYGFSTKMRRRLYQSRRGLRKRKDQ